MGIQYILIIVISIAVLYYKYDDINIEHFFTPKTLNEYGVKITMPIKKQITVGLNLNRNSYLTLGRIFKNYLNYKIVDTENCYDTLERIQLGQIDFGLCQSDIVYDAIYGDNYFNNNKLKNLRGVCGLLNDYLFLIINTKRTREDINTMEDIKNSFDILNRNIIIGVDQSGEEFNYLKTILTINNISYKNINEEIKPQDIILINKKHDKLFDLFMEDKIDGIFTLGGINDIKINNIIQNKPYKFLDLNTDSNIADSFFNNLYKINLDVLSFNPNQFNKESLVTRGSRIILVTNKNTNNKKVYKFVESIFNKNNIIRNIFSKIFDDKFEEYYSKHYQTEIIPVKMAYMSKYIPMHKGALEYYTKLGYITRNENPECLKNVGKKKCEYGEDVKLQTYWKYKQIGLKKFNI